MKAIVQGRARGHLLCSNSRTSTNQYPATSSCASAPQLNASSDLAEMTTVGHRPDHIQPSAHPALARIGGHSGGHSTRPYCTEPDRTQRKRRPTWPGQTQLDRKEQKMGSHLLNSRL
jgi:hypothetical protein